MLVALCNLHLAEFKALYPQLRLDISYSRDIVDFSTSTFDAAVIFGESNRKGLASIMISNKRVAVCSPSLLGGRDVPLSAEQVARLPLATTKGHSTGWLEWFAAAGIDDTSSIDFVEFADGGLAYDFAATGEGVALVSDIPLIKHELAIGALVRINPHTITLDYGIYLFFPETQHPDPKVLAFANWLKSVVARIEAG